MPRRADLEAVVPGLRRYARGLTGDAETADDLVQGALLSALRSTGLGRGEALRRRLYAILTDFNRIRASDAFGAPWTGEEDPLPGLGLAEREAILLVAVEEFSYADAADIIGVSRPALVARLAGARDAALARAGRTARGHLRVVAG